MKRRIIVWLSVALSVLVGIFGVLWYQLHRDFHNERRSAESAVTRTVESIRHLGALETLSSQVITNAGVDGASVQILSTSPVVFIVRATTPWPDWMVYEFDSKSPERG